MNLLGVGAGLVVGALVALAPVARAQQEPGPALAPGPAEQGLPPISVTADDPWTVCATAIAAAEPTANLPQGLLLAISLVESGRRHPETGLRTPWPWSWNAGGEPGYAETREEAIAAVRAIMDEGQRSVDIGCMQVNLLQHPTAFASVEEAFDPDRNLAYAIRFLHRLRARNRDWGGAIADYHSGTPSLGQAYHRRVLRAGQATGVDTAAIALPVPPPAPVPARGRQESLCAPGFRPLLVSYTPPRGRAAPLQRPRARLVCQPARVQYAQALPPRSGRDAARAPYRVAVAVGRDPALLPLPPAPPSRQPAARLSPRRPAGIKK